MEAKQQIRRIGNIFYWKFVELLSKQKFLEGKKGFVNIDSCGGGAIRMLKNT
jgi:hypothetical protein